MSKFIAFAALKGLCETKPNNPLITKLRYYLSLKKWSKVDRSLILSLLSEAILNRELRPHVSRLFAPILSELLVRLKCRPDVTERLFVAVSDLIGYFNSATHFAYQCFQTSVFSPIALLEHSIDDHSVLDILISSFNYLHFHPIWFRDSIDWSFVLQYTSHPNPDIRYVSLQLYIVLFSVCDNQLNDIFVKHFTHEELTQLRVKYLYLFCPRIPTTQLTDVLFYDRKDEEFCEDFEQCFYDLDFNEDIVSVEGVFINKYKTNCDSSDKNSNKLVLVPTTQCTLRSLALAVAYGKPVLIEGPVGCGKTLLIEYLASLTGRYRAPELMKVQMGDQIDSKVLIGAHICTDIPGEFIWRAGPLTNAMKHGYWLVLEDIDCAPSDVISMLSSVLETNSLSSLAGCENQLNRVHNEFRIFFTRRLINPSNNSKHSEFAIKSSIHCNYVNKLCQKISMNCMKREELLALISKKWQNLCPIRDRILDIYYYLQNDCSENTGLKRQICLRDLMKWCQRISKSFKLNSDESALTAFLDANDCFLQSIASPTLRVSKAEQIGSHLNINKSQSEYLCAKRKPEFILNEKLLKIGRISTKLSERSINLLENQKHFRCFALTQQSLALLERISVAIDNNEPVLLCGETGTGKTSCVQYLANRLNKSLTVINMNQQSDSTDLLGGYKPIEMRILMQPLRDEYLDLFSKTFEAEKNATFLTKIAQKFRSEDWEVLFQVMICVIESALTKALDNEITERWKSMRDRIRRLETFKLTEKGCLAFSFIEGSLVKAMRSGHWILLDEINLAETETLQCLSSILDTDGGSVVLLDKADGLPVDRNPQFRLFACMNPATDVGKKELPLGIRNRFSEFFVDELEDKSDLRILIHSYIGSYVSPNLIERIVGFYLQIKIDSKQVLTDTNGMRAHYSLRTLCRALSVGATNPCGVILRSLYESFCLSFLTRLDNTSRLRVETEIIKTLFVDKSSLGLLKTEIPAPKAPEKYECIEGFYILRGHKEPKTNDSYILTTTVKKNLKDICRIVSIGKTFPILLEGETSVGKTSLIEWLAARTGNVCVRVNNHEHTDLQEYVGSYCVNTGGKLVFREGVLAEAMRNGYWIILDELNLAPTEVLEALNRVLDDNRELFIPETQTLIKADPKFLLLATQNPAGHYGGRKVLSRAFRNRFVELNFDSIPSNELEVILHQRCCLPMSYSKRMVSVLQDLQIRRRESGVFAGKQGFITLRDLFRWGERYKKFAKQHNQDFYDWDLHLARDGYLLLGGRVRKPEEMAVIQEVLENRFRRKLDTNVLFSDTSFLKHFQNAIPEEFGHIVWNKSLKRLGTLLSEAIKYNEPVLLIGDTGCGKTSICQLFAALNGRQLYSINCHMNTESADFLGSLRPIRNFDSDVNQQSTRALFEWVDGPLVDAMKTGSFFLVDEISLADDSVLERLNSVLESERTLLIAENNNTFDNEISIPVIKAEESFRYMATMNPGGDYGKKELSPALRNRFTEIWCPPYEDIDDIKDIIRHNLDKQWFERKDIICESICDFILWFNSNVLNSKRIVLSVRDILSWTQFINTTTRPSNPIPMCLSDAFTNGALFVFIDAIGSASSLWSSKQTNLVSIRSECEIFLKQLSQSLVSITSEDLMDIILDNNKYFSINPFCIPKGPEVDDRVVDQFMWNSPTVQSNAIRVLRAMQLPKPILLEGMPGVGKTTLVQALAKASGHRLIRINLSEQTDISDLFGADLPIEGRDSAGKFQFRDGPLLRALKSEWTWILLDELNLAAQAVLEGLNACLDHRNEIFIPELNRSFKISKTMTRIFATQNPHSEGGARKGLPRSFVNRFTSVYMQTLSTIDYIFILSNMFPNIEDSVIQQMVAFNEKVIDEVVVHKRFGRRGSPWEFNLRELIRWSQVMTQNISDFNEIKAEKFIKFLFIDKMRTIEDRIEMKAICEQFFTLSLNLDSIDFKMTDNYLQIGHSVLKRRRSLSNELLNYVLFESQKQCLESLMKCIEMNWMSILIGQSGVGKSTVVKMLSDLTGHKLCVLSVNSEMDTMDLLGGFEQKDLSQELKHIEDVVIEFCSEVFRKSVQQSNEMKDILKIWFELQSISESSDQYSLKRLTLLATIVEKLSKLKDISSELTSNLMKTINELKSCYENKLQVNGTFEWRDSILIRALIDGEWLLIENANLCSASVLDRLNGLLEPNGQLTINEKGSIDGQFTTITPHPDFRLILSMDPMNGELSRAMRNRGIEINMFPITSKEDISKQISVLVKSDGAFQQFLINCFEQSFDEYNEKLNFSLFIENIKHFIFKIQNGLRSELSLKELCERFDKQCISGEVISDLMKNIVSNSSEDNNKEFDISLNHFKYDSSTSCAFEDSVILKDLIKSGKSVELNDIELTSLRLYYEKSSQKDHSIRNYVLKNSSFNQYFNNNSELVKQIGDNIQLLSTKTPEMNVLTEFQIDLRFNTNVWHLFLNLNKCYENDIELIDKQLNRFSVNLFWDQLKCQQMNGKPVNDKELMSFMQISCDLIDNKIPRNSFPKAFITIFNVLQEIEEKLIKRCLELCPTNDDFMPLRDMILWYHQLLIVCHQSCSKAELLNQFIVNKFTVLWIIIIEKSLSVLQSFLNIDLNSCISSVNQLLEIKSLESHKKTYKLLLSLTRNNIVFKCEESADLYVTYYKLSEDIIKTKDSIVSDSVKDYNLLIANNMLSLISGQYNRNHLKKDISLIEQMLMNSAKKDMDCEEDIDFVEVIANRKSMATKQFEPLVMFSLLYSELNYFIEKSNHLLKRNHKLFESKLLTLNPFHILSIICENDCQNISTDLMLQHFIDFNQKFKIQNVFTLLNNNSNDLRIGDIFDERLLQLTSECLPFMSLTSSYLLSNKDISIGLLSQRMTQLLNLKQFLSLNFETICDSDNKRLTRLQFQFVRNWFSSLMQNVCLNSPVKKSCLNVQNNGFEELFNKISLMIEESKDPFDESIVLVFIGLITSHLLCPTFPIDPIERINCKLNHYIIDLKLINAELNVRKTLANIRSNSFSMESCVHPLVSELIERKKRLEEKIKAFESNLPFRSSSAQYFQLKSDCILFLETIIERKTIERHSKKLIDFYRNKNNSKKSLKDLTEESINFQISINSFITRIQTTYPLYQDLLNVFLIGVSMLLKGLKNANFYIQNQNFVLNELKFKSISEMNETMKIVGNYCNTYSPEFIANYLCDSQTINKMTKMSNFAKLHFETNVSTLLRSALLEIQNQMSLNYSESLLMVSNRILSVFVKCWQKQREEEELKRSEEEALFEYRMKSHESEPTEEERDKTELETIFPTFHEHYSDFITDFTVEDKITVNLIELKSDDTIITDIISTHLKIIESIESNDKSVPDFRKSYLLRHSVISEITKCLGIFFNNSIDCELICGQMIACNEIISDINNSYSENSFNIYKNSSIYETNNCLKILETLENRIVVQLLPQFERNPILIKLLKIIENILSLNTKEPLMKFATGLEVLLEAAQDWQLMAHRGISLTDNLNELTQLLISWRKLELKYWSECLDSVNTDINEKQINKFWFHLFITITALIENKTTDGFNQNDIKEFVVSIKRFIENSKIGEFKVRLSLLHTFSLHVLSIEGNNSLDNNLFISLHNLHKFYSQFIPNIEKALMSVRNPIEKEVKEFVKITKWKDSNFWAVKSAVDKSHKQLFKYMKRYKSELLNQTIDLCFDSESNENKNPINSRELKLNFKNYISIESEINENNEPNDQLIRNFPFLENNSSFITKSKRLSKRALKKCSYIVNQINAMESFTTDMIIEMKDLSELQVPNDIKDKIKYKRTAHHIHSRKRRALSELFKTLTQFGLSYRKGLVIDNEFDLNEIIITTGPLDYNFRQYTQLSHQLIDDLNSCDKYFYKCLARFGSLRTALETPNKQLSIGNVERIKGFSTQLMKKVIQKRQTISYHLFCFKKMKTIQQNLKLLSKDNDLVIIPSNQFNECLTSAQNLIVRIIAFILRSIDLLNSWSTGREEPVLLLSSDYSVNISEQNITEIKHKLNDYYLIFNEMIEKLKTFESIEEIGVNSGSDLNLMKDIYKRFWDLMKEMKTFYSNQNFSLILSTKFTQLFDESLVLCEKFMNYSENYCKESEDLDNFENIQSFIDLIANQCTKSVKIILFSIQKIYKSLNDSNTDKTNEDLLKDSLNLTDIRCVLNDFHIKDTMNSITKLLKVLNTDYETNENSVQILTVHRFKGQLVKTIYPFIEIYTNICEYLITISMFSLKTSNKLLFILLSLFSELTQNGFCLPPELTDETEGGDMGTEFKSVEDGGIGEGQGTKDVSDRIESEDQIEGLKDQTKGEKGDENDERDIEEEEKGLEMENDFDGQTFSPSKGDNEEENDKSDDEDSDDNLEEQMGDIDNNSEVLDEKIWGSDNEDMDSDQTDAEDDTGFAGKDSFDNKIVANDENKDLKQDFDEKDLKEREENQEINENSEQNDEYSDECRDPYKQLNENNEKPNQELPENMELDLNEDNEDNEGDDQNCEDVDNKSLSGESMTDEEKHSDLEEQEFEDLDQIEDQLEDKPIDENVNKTEVLENTSEDIENKEEDIESQNKESNPNPHKESVDSANDETIGSQNRETLLENQMNDKNSAEVYAEENAEQNSDQNVGQTEEQHGFSEALVGDHSTQTESQQIQSSASFDDSEAKEQRFQNNKRDKTERTLAEEYDKSAKRLKVLPNDDKEVSDPDINSQRDSEKQTINSDIYRHVVNQSMANNRVIDIASNEEKLIQNEEIENKDIDLNKPEDMDTTEDNKESIDELKPIVVKSEKMKSNFSDNTNESKKEQMNEEVMNTEGEVVSTHSVRRGNESTFHTSSDLNPKTESNEISIDFEKRFDELIVKDIKDLDNDSKIEVWKECEAKVSALVYELCERLQLVLEPTKMSKLKGDYRTGKRLNMRKVIAYIASDFRKDKIWLRRTKASKREFRIVIAVDDSESMSDNKSKQMAFESLALLGKSLSILEAGELAIMSFGQTVSLLHSFGQPFNDSTGAHLITRFGFNQSQTRIADLLQSVIELMSTSRPTVSSPNADISQLLIIVSDGRGIYSEGEQRVKQMIRKVKELSIFMVFVVIDSPLSKDSILDIRVPIFDTSGSVRIESYLERFPFPFYILLRDINGLPHVMGEALRQWFELITSGGQT